MPFPPTLRRMFFVCAAFCVAVPLPETFSQDQQYSKFMVTASLEVGYTFHAGVDWGFHAGTGFIRTDVNNVPVFAGVSTTYRTFPYGDHHFRVVSLNAMAQVDNRLNLSLGLARTWFRWGLEGRNVKASNGWGRYIDVNYKLIDAVYSPMIGYRSGKINNRCMSFVKKSARSFYTGYRYDLFFINQETAGHATE